VGRVIDGMSQYRLFRQFIDPVFQVRLPSTFIEQEFNPALLNRCLIAIEGIAGQTHRLAGSRHIAQFFSQIQQADFMFNDAYVILKHEGYLFRLDKNSTLLSHQ
jgi:hypothetical protein